MKSQQRRAEIVKILSVAEAPVSARVFAEQFSVSRQIIVKDISYLRASGMSIPAKGRGYVLIKDEIPKRVLKTIHSDEEVGDELRLIVDMGGIVEDVFIYHKIYNKVTAKLNIRTRADVDRFLSALSSGQSGLLKNATSGYHYHTVLAESYEILSDIENALWEKGYLAPLKSYEPEELFNK